MQEKARVPAIRFAGFTDAWEQRKFGDDLISVQTGTNKLGSDKGKGIPLLKMGNIQRGYFSVDQVHARAMGTTSVAAIYPRSLNSIEYFVPSMNEQKAIGSFLLNLDHLITLHQREHRDEG